MATPTFRRHASLVAAFAFIGIVLAGGFVAHQVDSYEPLRRQQERLLDKYASAQRIRLNFAAYKTQLSETEAMLHTLTTRLPNADTLDVPRQRIDVALRTAAGAARVDLQYVTYGALKANEFYVEWPFSMRASGDFASLLRFLQAISTGSAELRMIWRLTLQRHDAGDALALVLDGVAFGYLSEELIAASRRSPERARQGKGGR